MTRLVHPAQSPSCDPAPAPSGGPWSPRSLSPAPAPSPQISFSERPMDPPPSLCLPLSQSALTPKLKALLGPRLSAWELFTEKQAVDFEKGNESLSAVACLGSAFIMPFWVMALDWTALLLFPALGSRLNDVVFPNIERLAGGPGPWASFVCWTSAFVRMAPLLASLALTARCFLSNRLASPLSALDQANAEALGASAPAARDWLDRARWKKRALRRADLLALRVLAQSANPPPPPS